MDDKIQATLPDEVGGAGRGGGSALLGWGRYQNGRFSPQKVLSEGEIDENFKQLFKQLAGPVRGWRGR